MRVLACIAVIAAFLAGPLLAADSRKTVAVGDLTVSYGEFGPVDGVPLVLVHGGGITPRMWGGFAPEAAAAGYHVFTPDTRNHGGTDNPSGTFSYDLAAGDLAGFITALKLDQPVVMGYSDGGMIVATFLLADPATASAAIVGGMTNKVAATPHYFAGMQTYYGYDKGGALPDAVLDALALGAPDFVARLQALPATAAEPDRWRSLHKLVWPVWTTPRELSLAAFGKVDAPVLVILGQDDEFSLPQDALALAQALPNGEIAIIPGAHHTVFRDNPVIFNALVLDFLTRHKAH